MEMIASKYVLLGPVEPRNPKFRTAAFCRKGKEGCRLRSTVGKTNTSVMGRRNQDPVAGVLDEPYSQLTPLSGVAEQARQST
jgi:hypothetical protein